MFPTLVILMYRVSQRRLEDSRRRGEGEARLGWPLPSPYEMQSHQIRFMTLRDDVDKKNKRHNLLLGCTQAMKMK